MNDIIILPSGNVVPSLSEQPAYVRLRREQVMKRTGGKAFNWRTISYSRHFRKWDISSSGESRFIQTGHEPKAPGQVRLDWREKKQFKRDKARHGSFGDGCPPFIKRMCNKRHRQWERDCIRKGKDEELMTCKNTYIYDTYLWN